MKILSLWPFSWRSTGLLGVACLSVAMIMISVFRVDAAGYTQLMGQVDLGSSSSDVTSLQMLLKDNPEFYPEGIVSGYYGPLTAAAVARFQVYYGIPAVGRVGPMTLQKINAIIAGGGWSSSAADRSGPWIYGVSQTVSSDLVTLSWSTNEPASAKVFYNTGNVMMSEGDINSVGFGNLNGQVAQNDTIARTSQQITINGLRSGTLYHYVIVATDASGNVSVWNPNTTFVTK